MEKLSRRSLVTAAAALPTLAVSAAPATAVPKPDPVFDVVAAHRRAYRNRMRAAQPTVFLEPGDPREKELEAACDAACEVFADATDALSDVVPTSMAGVLTLLGYLGEIFEQEVYLSEDPANWHSGGEHNYDAALNTAYTAEDLFDKFSGEPLELPLTYWVMQNVIQALAVIGRNQLPPFAPLPPNLYACIQSAAEA